MKKLLLLLLYSPSLHAQTINDYFEKIRHSAVELTAFFSQMPKGGDLHHHFSGSVYTETFIDAAVENDFYVHPITLAIRREAPVDTTGWTRFSKIKRDGLLFDFKQRLFRKWSARDYNETDYPSHRQFFESFDHFGPATDLSQEKGLLEIKSRAKAENVSYIETMFRVIRCNKDLGETTEVNSLFRSYQEKKDYSLTRRTLDSLYSQFQSMKVAECAIGFTQEYLHKLHASLKLDDSSFTLRYQAFVIRLQDPVTLFKNLVVAFEAADRSPLLVGVNIVAPEHYDVAMQDYWLHMQMFIYCKARYPNVKYSMHAGELTLGLVKPEDLTWHISEAVYQAKPARIGHGVDIAYEKENYALLEHMRAKDIPIEINLGSNEFILKVKEDRHPILLYKRFNVPIVISTDDEGILRTNLIEQYVLLASRYPAIKYADIKRMVYNSIQYSFIEEAEVKKRLRDNLDRDFKKFESMVMRYK
ncbi:MAG: adenosine deaminase [Chitinophagaceae bacterium]|nr:adenosine deaminase [Chitinophagaceae bacterium]